MYSKPEIRRLFLDRTIKIPWFREEMMRDTRVTVVGLGNIGSQLLIALCGLGIGEVTLIDKDIVEFTNLQRQTVYSYKDLNRPKVDAAVDFVKRRYSALEIKTKRMVCDVRYAELPESDYVFCCVDNDEARKVVLDQCLQSGTPLIDTGLEFYESQAGHVLVVDRKLFPDGACVDCYLDLGRGSPEAGCIAAGITYSGGTVANVAAGMFVQHVHRKLKANHFFIDLNSCTAEFMFLRKRESCRTCGKS